MFGSAPRLGVAAAIVALFAACQLASPKAASPADEAPPEIGSGLAHTCLLTQAGAVICWGQGADPDFSPDRFGRPISVEGLERDVAAIGVGWYHTCAAKKDGHVECWGQNTSGQLGSGVTENTFTPVEVEGLDEVISVSAGAGHTCALTSNASVYCWGLNSSGQLGDGTATDRAAPAKVTGLAGNVTDLAAGSAFTCALLSQGDIVCWGEIGFATESATEAQAYPEPVAIAGSEKDVAAIAAGTYHICALTKAGEVDCRGSIFSPTEAGAPSPFDTGSLAGRVVRIMAGTDFNCAQTKDGEVECWGDNYFGQLGDPALPASNPVAVAGIGGRAVKIGGGCYTACVLISDGSVRCWGDTSFGQLGDGTARWK